MVVKNGLGKAKEVPEAIRKATQVAMKNMIKVPLSQEQYLTKSVI